MKTLKRVSLSCLTLAAALLAATPVAAADGDSYGYIRVLEGSATVVQAGSSDTDEAEVNLPVLAGDRLLVERDGRLELLLADRTLVRVDGGSELLLERLANSPDADDRATVLRLLEGNIQFVVTRDWQGDQMPRVETPNATFYAQAAGVYRVTADRDGWSELVVRQGTAEVVTGRGSQVVRADEEALVEGEGRYASAEVRSASSYDSLERWARKMDEDYGSDDLRYVDESLRYAAAPLARHGSWIQYENRSYWRPRVDAGWRPYWNGRWRYTPSGLTWVAYEPWGWVPYHYGSWDYLPGYGWAWEPGYRYAPAWVYWYWGPSYVGWCPTGYYTRYYGRRSGFDIGFRFGVYGYAGGHWGYDRWNFVSNSYFRGYRDGYRDGYRNGRHDGRRDHWDVRRYAVPIDDLRRKPLDRGIITTDTKPLRPDTWRNHDEVVRVLRDQRRGTGAGELPDVTSFIDRKPDLSPTVARWVRADNNQGQLDGTPLKPATLGPRNTKPLGRDGREGNGGTTATGSGRPWVELGNDRPGGSGRQPVPSEKPNVRSASPDKPETGAPAEPSSGRRAVVRDEKPARPDSPEREAESPRPNRWEAPRGEKPNDNTDRPSGNTDRWDNRGETRPEAPRGEKPNDTSGDRDRKPPVVTRIEDRRSLPRVQPGSPSGEGTRDSGGVRSRSVESRDSYSGRTQEPSRRDDDRGSRTWSDSSPSSRVEREKPSTYSRPEPRESPRETSRETYSRPEPRSSSRETTSRPAPRSKPSSDYEKPAPRSSEPSTRSSSDSGRDRSSSRSPSSSSSRSGGGSSTRSAKPRSGGGGGNN